jgi:probable F420-dependent oxidoreductase
VLAAEYDRGVEFAVPLFPYDRWGSVDAIAEAAEFADAAGIHALQFPDHVFMPLVEGKPDVSVVWHDNFVLGAYVAARTKRLRLIFNVLVIPYRPAILLAKAISTLDTVSHGRLTLGVGAGWLKGEFKLLGVPFEQRGALTDEYLRAMKALWTEEKPEFSGATVRFSRIGFEPRCVQKPHVPLWIGGTGPAPWRRALELGDGWSPMVGTLDELAPLVARMKQQLAARGRDTARFAFNASVSFGETDALRETARRHASHTGERTESNAPSTPDALVELVGRYREAGFTNLSLSFAWETPADYLRKLEWLGAKVLPQLR